MISVFVFGFCLQSYEQPFQYSSGQNWDSVVSGLWCTIVTMSTVGYGDFYPVTHVGRFIAIFAMMWGQFLISLLLIAMVITADFSTQEEKAFNSIKTSEFYNEMALQCLVVIQYWSLGRLLRMGKLPQRYLKVGAIRASRMAEIKLRLAIHSFILLRKTYVSTVMAEGVDIMIQKLNAKIQIEVRSLEGYTEFGNRINQLVGEVERSTELNLERANWLLNEWIDKYKDLGYRLQVLCHVKPTLKYPASKSWTNSEDICFDADKTIIAQLDLYPRFWNCMEQSIGREKLFLGLTLEVAPNFDYEITAIAHNKKYKGGELERTQKDHSKGKDSDRGTDRTKRVKGAGKLKKSRDAMGKISNSTKDSRLEISGDEPQTGVQKQEMGFGNDLIGNPLNVDELMTKDRKMKYQTGNALKNLAKPGTDPTEGGDSPDVQAPEKKKKKKKLKKKAKAKKSKSKADGEIDAEDEQERKTKANN